MKKIAIIVLNYNGEKDIIECLKTLENVKCQMSNVKCQIIVVDNAPADASASVISNFKFQISNFQYKFIRNNKNLGFTGGNNVGIRAALDWGADYVLLLNNDTTVDESLLTELLKTAESEEEIGIVVPKIYFSKGYEYHKEKYKKDELGKVFWYAGGIMDWKNIIGHHRGVDEVDRGQYEKEEEIEMATGCSMLIKRKVFEKIGLLDEKYFLYYEDSDFSQQVKRAGFKIMYAPKAIVWHKNAGSAGGSGSSLQDYYITRNRLIFGIKYAPFRSRISLIRESFELLINGRKWQKRGVLDFYLRRFGRGSYE